MKLHTFSLWLLILLLGIFTFNLLGLLFDWYWTVWWYDIPMHITGGAWLALSILYLERRLPNFHKVFGENRFLLFLMGIAVAAIVWEFFEYAVDVAAGKYAPRAVPWAVRYDSFADVLNGLLGGAAVLGVLTYLAKGRAKRFPPLKK